MTILMLRPRAGVPGHRMWVVELNASQLEDTLANKPTGINQWQYKR